MHTVVLATLDRADDVQRLLACLESQTRRPDRIVVCDDTGDDSVRRLLDDCTIEHRYERNSTRPSLTRSRNLAIPHLLPGIVTFLDSDIILEPDYLERIFAALEARPDAIGAMGWVTDFPRGGAIKDALTAPFLLTRATRSTIRLRFPLRIHYPRTEPPAQDTNWLYGCNMTFRSEVFEQHRFNDRMERYSYAEDLEMSTRVRKTTGRPYLVVPEAHLHHHRNDEGRMVPLDIYRMRMVHRHIIVHHLHRPGPFGSLLTWYSDLGQLAFYSYMAPSHTLAHVRAFVQVARTLRKRRADVRAGNFAAFNDLYGFWTRDAQAAADSNASSAPDKS